MGRPPITVTVLLGTVLAAVFSPPPQPSSGQQQLPDTNRKPACTIFCGDPSPVPKVNYFWLFTREQWEAKKCYGGPLPADQATNHYNGLTKEERIAICQNLNALDEPTKECPAFKRLAWLCKNEPPPKNNCEKPTPWFGAPPSDCKDVQSPVVTINAGAATLVICGFPVFRSDPSTDRESLEGIRNSLISWLKERIGSKVCCDKFREAAKTGNPCYPAVDVDCDGKVNNQDGRLYYPDINTLFSIGDDEAAIDPFPPGLNPDDTEFFPPQDKCDCKWQLNKGKLHCSPGRGQRHFYEASWKCPSNGNEITTRKYAAATAPCQQL